jgi:hypothetical protein
LKNDGAKDRVVFEIATHCLKNRPAIAPSALHKGKTCPERLPQFPVLFPLFAHIADVVFAGHQAKAVPVELKDQACAPPR